MKQRFTVFVLSTLVLALVLPGAWWAANRPSDEPVPADIAAHANHLTVASLNLAKVTDVEGMAREFSEHPILGKADVVLLQEVVRASPAQPSTAELLARRLGRQAAFASPDGATTFSGIAIMTALPMRDIRTRVLKNVNLVFRSRKRIAIAATVDTPRGPVRILNAHLDTRINPAERVEQLGPALDEAYKWGGRVLIGGDFNTNDMQWVSHVVPVPHPGWQADAVRKLMAEKGFATPFVVRRATFDHLGMQLDWLFTKGLKPLRSAIQPIEFSDHHAIWAEFDLGQI